LFYHAEGALGRAYDEALVSARLDPGDAAAWRLAGVEAIELRRFPEAETALRQALSLRRADWRSHLALGNALLAQRRDQEARGALEEAERLSPGEPAAHFELSRVYQRLGLSDPAARETRLHQQTLAYGNDKYNLLSSIYQVRNDVAIRLKLARLCAAHGDF